MIKQPRQHFERGRARALEMLLDPMAVKEMEDHSYLYFLPEAFEQLSFLYHSPRQQSFQEPVGSFEYQFDSPELRDDLCHLIDYYLKLGIDIIVVDQTSLEQAAQGFRCVKVLMPGMLPMTFGHQYRRVSGFKRLSQLPYQLGYSTRPLADADINPYPHPFP